MPYNESFYPWARIGSGMILHFRTPEEELIHEAFAHETVAVSQAENNLELLGKLTLTKLRTNIGAP